MGLLRKKVVSTVNLSICSSFLQANGRQNDAFSCFTGALKHLRKLNGYGADYAYIGETENFRERVKDHDSKKAFWQKALLFISKDAAMTKADVQYLEHRAIAEAKISNTFVLNAVSYTHLTLPTILLV